MKAVSGGGQRERLETRTESERTDGTDHTTLPLPLTELEIESVGTHVVGGGEHAHHHHSGPQSRQQPVVRRDAVFLVERLQMLNNAN